MLKKVLACSTIVFVLFLFFPGNLSAENCPYCGSPQYKSRPYYCDSCGMLVSSPSYNRSSSHYYPVKYASSSWNKHNVSSRKFRVPKGNWKNIVGSILILIGAFLFWEYPWIGIPLIILGLFLWYRYFKTHPSPEEQTAENLSPDSTPPSNGGVKNNNAQQTSNRKLRIRPSNRGVKKNPGNSMGMRPTRTMSSESGRTSQTVVSIKNSTSFVNDSAPNISLRTGAEWYAEGVLFCTGEDGREIDFLSAKACFHKAIENGVPEAQEWLDYLNSQQ